MLRVLAPASWHDAHTFDSVQSKTRQIPTARTDADAPEPARCRDFHSLLSPFPKESFNQTLGYNYFN